MRGAGEEFLKYPHGILSNNSEKTFGMR